MNFCVETCDVSSLVPRRILWHGEETIFCRSEEGCRKGEEGLQKKWETRRDETLTLDVRDAVRTYHCKNTTPCTPCTPHPVTTRHDHFEAVVVRITGELRVHHCQGILQVEDLIVITVVFAARQNQRRRGPCRGSGPSEPHSIPLQSGHRCTAFREHFQRLVKVPIKLIFDLLLCADLLKKFEYSNVRVSKYFDACWFTS